jgi:hypothetical protein
MSAWDADQIERVEACWTALVDGTEVTVATGSREFRGHVYEIGRSPYHDDLTARVVDDEGRVHYFRPTRGDCQVRSAGYSW